jgi:hypothetical protein
MAVPASIVIRAFAAGELAPSLAARADLAQYTMGLRTCRNFFVQRHGGVANRPGLQFVGFPATTSATVRLLRYVSPDPAASVLIEAGSGYLRFWSAGAPVAVDPDDVDAWAGGVAYGIGDLVTSGGTTYYCVHANTDEVPPNTTYWHALPDDVYEIPTPFTTRTFHWSQAGPVITFTHPAAPPHELVFEALTRWIFRPVTTAPAVQPPTNVTLEAGSGDRRFGYVVTAAAPDSYEESESSAQVINAAAAEPTDAAPHVLTWDAVLTPPTTGTPSPEYYVYCDPLGNGTYGFIGTTTGAATFRNPGLTPDFSLTPPLPRVLFDAEDQYPTTSCVHKQRRVFANTHQIPDGVWMSRVGLASNFGISSPLQDADALTFRIAGNNAAAVRHLVSLKQLVVMTDAGAWRVAGAGGAPLTPSTVDPDQDTYVGAAPDVRPVVIGNAVVYVQARASLVHDIRFDEQVEGLAGRDLTVLAAHLFDGYTITAIDYAQTPHSIVWAVRSDGTLLGLTYLREQNVIAWHRHDTAGTFEDVCVVPEPGEDAVYVLVKRTLGGDVVRTIERFAPRTILDFNADSVFVDCGLSYHGAAVASVSGLEHLAGEVVAVVGDGTVLSDGSPTGANAARWTVPATGVLSLGALYADVHVGLPIRFAELETLDLDIAGSSIRDKPKRVQSLTVIVDGSSRSFWAGRDADHLVRYRQASFDPTDAAFTGQVELSVPSTFTPSGRVVIRQTDPLPLTVLGVVPRVEVGG